MSETSAETQDTKDEIVIIYKNIKTESNIATPDVIIKSFALKYFCNLQIGISISNAVKLAIHRNIQTITIDFNIIQKNITTVK